MSPMGGDYLTTSQIARDLGVTPPTVRSWIKSGDLKIARVTPWKLRVHRSVYEQFRISRGLFRKADSGSVLAVACEIIRPGDLGVIVAGNAFDAGAILSANSPQFVVVSWTIGKGPAAQLASGCRTFGYSPILVAVRPSDWPGDPHEFRKAGYHHEVEVPTGAMLRSIAEGVYMPPTAG